MPTARSSKPTRTQPTANHVPWKHLIAPAVRFGSPRIHFVQQFTDTLVVSAMLHKTTAFHNAKPTNLAEQALMSYLSCDRFETMLDPFMLPIVSGNTCLRLLTTADKEAYVAGVTENTAQGSGRFIELDFNSPYVKPMLDDVATPDLGTCPVVVLALADAETNMLVGTVVWSPHTFISAEVSVRILPDSQGKGYTRAGLELATRFAHLSGLHTLTASTEPGNQVAQHELKAAGFQEVIPSEEAVSEKVIHFNRELVAPIRWPLVTERLQLRLFQPGDTEWLYQLYSQPDVARFLLDEPWTKEVTEEKLAGNLAKTGIESPNGSLELAVEYQGVPIGNVTLWLTDSTYGQGEVGWVFNPKYGGRGFASEAVQAVLALGFEHYDLHRIVAQMDARNSASAALARRVGLRQEAHLIQNWFSKGEWTDTLIFAQLATEYAASPHGG